MHRVIGDDLNHRRRSTSDLTGHDRDLCQIAQANPGQLDPRDQSPACRNAAVDVSTAAVDRVHGDSAFLAMRQQRFDHPESTLVQGHHHHTVPRGARIERARPPLANPAWCLGFAIPRHVGEQFTEPTLWLKPDLAATRQPSRDWVREENRHDPRRRSYLQDSRPAFAGEERVLVPCRPRAYRPYINPKRQRRGPPIVLHGLSPASLAGASG